MSSISSIGSGTQGIYQFIQSLTGASQLQPSTASGTGSTPSSDPTQALSQILKGSHHHHRHGGGGGLKQIQDAVTSALQTAQSTGSTTDPNKIIEDAIAQVLQNNNGASSSSSANGTGTGTTDTSGTGATNSSAADSSGKTSAQSFYDTLQSLGVSPKQFQQDFLAAIKDAQGGQVNPSTAFQSMPVGATVDTIG